MHISLKSISALLLSASLLPVSYAVDNDEEIARINGDPIMKSELITYARLKNPQANLSDRQIQQQLLQAYVGRELLYQEAMKQKLEQLERVQLTLENQRREVLSQALAAKIMSENPVTEAQAREVYQRQASTENSAEYRTSHILTRTEQDAKKAVERLDKGESFEQVARSLSTDASASQGGQIGWVNPGQMPDSFAAALRSIKVGGYSKSPVQTRFGWHVIKVDASRPASVPPFEQVRDQLMQRLAEQRVSEYIAELEKKAKIEVTR